MSVVFRPMLAGDLVQLDLQHSQARQIETFGGDVDLFAKGAELAAIGDAWTATSDRRIIAIGGFLEQFPTEAVAWIALARDVEPRDGLAVTLHARREVLGSRYLRLETTVAAEDDRAVAWAGAIGLSPVHVMRNKGPDASTQILFERVKWA